MALSQEQINSYRTKYLIGTSTPAQKSQERIAKWKTPVQEEMTFGQKAKAVVKAIPGALISSEVALGKHLGNVIAAPGNVKQFEKGVSEFEAQSNRMVEKINELKAQGKDTSRLNQVFKEFNQRAPQTKDYFSDEQIAELEKGFWETAGEIGGVALDIATAGTYGIAAKVAKAGQLLTKSDRLASIASKVGIGSTKVVAGQSVKPTLLGILKGGAMQVAEGFGVGEAFDITQNLQAGETGMDIFTKGYGKYIGAALPATFLTAKLGSRIVGEVAGKTTGAGFGAIKEGWQASLEGGKRLEAFQNSMRNKVSPEVLVDEAKGALQTIIDNRRALYRENLSKLRLDETPINIKPIQDEVNKQLKSFGVEVTDKGLDFSRSKIRFDTSAQEDILKIFNEMKNYGTKVGDATLKEVDKLKQAFGSLYSKSSDVRAFVQAVKATTRQAAGKIGGYDDAMKAYEESTGLIEEIQKGLSLGDKVSVETSFKKLTSALRVNNDFRKAFIKDLDAASGGYLSSKIAGQQLSEVLPRGMAGVLDATGALGALLSGVGVLPILKFAIFASPRAVGEILSAIGLPIRLSRGLIQAIERNMPKLKAAYDSIPNKRGGFIKNPLQSEPGVLSKANKVNMNKSIANPSITDTISQTGEKVKDVPTEIQNLPLSDLQKNALAAVKEGNVTSEIKKVLDTIDDKILDRLPAVVFGPLTIAEIKKLGYSNPDEGELQAMDDEIKIKRNELPSNEEIKRQIAFRESGISGDPYKAKNIKNENGQIDYGKYQISGDKIKENGMRFLGRNITPDEFYNSPEIQEEFMDKMIEHLRKLGVKKFDSLLALHRKGFSDISTARINKLKQDPDVIKYLNNKPV